MEAFGGGGGGRGGWLGNMILLTLGHIKDFVLGLKRIGIQKWSKPFWGWSDGDLFAF